MIITGVIWVGPVYHRGGYGTVSRQFLTGLTRLGVPTRVVPYEGRHYSDIAPGEVALMQRLEAGDAGPHPALVIHSTPDMFSMMTVRGAAKTIGCTIFETHSIPRFWVKPCNSMDEVWVPSQFNRLSFARAGVRPDKLHVVPYGIEANTSSSVIANTPRKPPFTFLYVFEFGWRKGFDLLLSAFVNEFKLGEARLILKVLPRYRQTAEQARQEVLESVAPAPRNGSMPPEVIVISGRTTSADIEQLYSRCDLYISTDRANGWGMPCMEAMALGRPAATINWSGSTEFMTATNSVLIQPTGQLTPVDPRLARELPELYGDQCWAEVTEDEVRRAMRWSVAHPHELARIASKGQQAVRDQHSLETVAGIIVKRLGMREPIKYSATDLVSARIQFSQPNRRVPALKRRARRLWARWIQLPARRFMGAGRCGGAIATFGDPPAERV